MGTKRAFSKGSIGRFRFSCLKTAVAGIGAQTMDLSYTGRDGTTVGLYGTQGIWEE